MKPAAGGAPTRCVGEGREAVESEADGAMALRRHDAELPPFRRETREHCQQLVEGLERLVQPVVVHLVRLEQRLGALGVYRLHLRDDPLPADGHPELLRGNLATEDRPNGVLHGGEDDRPGVDQRAVEVEEDDAKPHASIVSTGSGSEPHADRAPRALEHDRVTEEHERRVRAAKEPEELERELLRLRLGRNLVARPRLLDQLCDETFEVRPCRLDRITNRAGPRAEVRAGRGEEAPAGEDVALKMRDVSVTQRDEPLAALLRFECGLDDLGVEDLVRDLDGRELKSLLRLEVRVQAALAHPRLLREPADRKAFEPFHGRELGGPAEDGAPAALAVRAAAACRRLAHA